MIDHILGKPSASWKRTQVFLVLIFWLGRLAKGDKNGPRIFWFRRINRSLSRFTPYQIILSTLTALYAVRHLDYVLGLGAPEPLARLYSPSYYRATWIATALDAGFATAMPIRPKWARDLCSILFAGYYTIYANEADEKLRKFRSIATVEMLRTTWEKAVNPYVRLFTLPYRPRLPLVRRLLIPRPSSSLHTAHLPPIEAMLFFDGTEQELAQCKDLVMDFPGGGFICMGPEHHEERLRRWGRKLGREAMKGGAERKRAVLSVDYGKSPEFPYPWAIEQAFDVYVTLVQTKGRVIGFGSGEINMVLTGDSAGGNIVATVMFKILEHPTPLPPPVALVFAYGALDFNFTSWMTPENLKTLRSEQSSANIPGMQDSKDHLAHRSPLAVVKDVVPRLRRKKSWTHSISSKLPFVHGATSERSPSPHSPSDRRFATLPRIRPSRSPSTFFDGNNTSPAQPSPAPDADVPASSEPQDSYFSPAAGSPLDDDEYYPQEESEKPLRERVRTPGATLMLADDEQEEEEEEQVLDLDAQQLVLSAEAAKAQKALKRALRGKKASPIGTRLTMTSRSSFFADRVIPPSMMRAMCILYLGPKQNPDFSADYYISPILAPMALLAHFPPVLMICGEKDPFVDDTVILAGRIREAKRARKSEAQRKEAGIPRGSRFGEGLRMSQSGSARGGGAGGGGRKRDPILDDEEEDWVQVKIYEGWGHGFLQMASLMPEVGIVIGEIADWMMGTFDRDLEFKTAALNGTSFSFPSNANNTTNTTTNGVTPSFLDDSSLAPRQDQPLSFTPKKHQRSSPGDPSTSSLPSPSNIDGLPSSGVVSTSESIFPTGSPIPPARNSPPPSLPRSLPSILASALSRSTTPTSASGITPPGTSTPRMGNAATGVAGAKGGAGPLDEAELMRRRRVDAVFGMGETHSGFPSDIEDDDGDSDAGFRSGNTSGVDLKSLMGREEEKELEEML